MLLDHTTDDMDCCACCKCCDTPPSQLNIDSPVHKGVNVCPIHAEENVYHTYKKMRPKTLHVYTDGGCLLHTVQHTVQHTLYKTHCTARWCAVKFHSSVLMCPQDEPRNHLEMLTTPTAPTHWNNLKYF